MQKLYSAHKDSLVPIFIKDLIKLKCIHILQWRSDILTNNHSITTSEPGNSSSNFMISRIPTSQVRTAVIVDISKLEWICVHEAKYLT